MLKIIQSRDVALKMAQKQWLKIVGITKPHHYTEKFDPQNDLVWNETISVEQSNYEVYDRFRS